MPLSVAFVGAGAIAGGYDERRRAGDPGIYSHAGAMREDGRFTLRTVFDPDSARAASFAARWGLQRVAASLDEVLSDAHDVLCVCSPDKTHFAVAREALQRRACRVLVVEKPLAMAVTETGELAALSRAAGVSLVVNFQRRHEASHIALRQELASAALRVLSANAWYMKGLRHIGTTMIDTLMFLFGPPRAVLAYHRVANEEAGEFSYEFVLFHEGHNTTVKTSDAGGEGYNFHLFEIDIMCSDGRVSLVDLSRSIRRSGLTGYAYDGVRVLDHAGAEERQTSMGRSMVSAAAYVHDLAAGTAKHTINTPEESYNGLLVVEAVEASYRRGSQLIELDPDQWKKP